MWCVCVLRFIVYANLIPRNVAVVLYRMCIICPVASQGHVGNAVHLWILIFVPVALLHVVVTSIILFMSALSVMMIVTSSENAVTNIFTFVSPKVIFWGLVQVENWDYSKPVTPCSRATLPNLTPDCGRPKSISISMKCWIFLSYVERIWFRNFVVTYSVNFGQIFSINTPTKCIYNIWRYSHFTPTCFGMTMPSSVSTRQVENHL